MELDFNKIPSDFLDKREVTFLYDINDRFKKSKEIVRSNFDKNERLEAAFDFLTYGILGESIKGDFDSLSRTWFFPSSEAEKELDNSINHCLIGSYKAAYDYLRRGLELVLTNIYLTSENTPREKAIKWVDSKSNTPFFSREVISNIIKYNRFDWIEEKYHWSKEIKDFYYKICDIVHVNGTANSYDRLNRTNIFLSGTTLVNIKEDTIIAFFNDFIEAMGFISLALSLYNPVILIDLPMTEKFGLNPPMCGFLEMGLAETVNILIPDKYKPYCEFLKNNDDEILGIKNWIESMPSLTKEQFDEQVKDQNDFFDNMNKQNNNNR
jgi:hypothetical protein